jgi:hypothetical protein
VSGAGALRLSLDGVNYVNIATGVAGTGLTEVTADANTFGGDGTPSQPLFLRSSSVTLQGNSFNAADRLVRLDGSARYPALEGSQITLLNASALASGTVAPARLDSGSVTLQGNSFNAADRLVRLDSSNRFPASDGSQITALNASALASGTVADGRLSANVTLQGNAFNGASQLVQLNGAGHLPALNAGNLTNLNASALAAGLVPNARLDSSSVTLLGPSIEPVELPADGYASTYLNASGDALTGTLQVNATPGFGTTTEPGVAFATNVFVTAGRLGIGTTLPSQPLTVSGNAELTGQLLASAGSDANPSLSFAGNPNTGFRSPSAAILTVINGGLERWRFNSGGDLIATGGGDLLAGAGMASSPGHSWRTSWGWPRPGWSGCA